MIDIITSVITSIIFPLLLFCLKKLYYLNHKITELDVKVEDLREDVRDIKEYLFKRLN